ncbi:hypothetical protein E4185_16905 [Aeromonas media]|uniref:hypothetical protein n=1 Tax=Aeromonas media TaxID=651 RepID=UPI00148AFF85|nr:hypothetical protein [Aeromonas media]QJT27579.1 hypothetical protein E4185_16905 [Aeromonas media]
MNLWEKMSAISNTVKIGGVIFTFVSAAIIANYKIGELETYSGVHDQNIQYLQVNESRNDNRILVLERKAERTDAQLDKLNDNLNALNLAIVELSTVIREMKKGS